jgi:hypothetical protein
VCVYVCVHACSVKVCTSPVDGFVTTNVLPDAAGTHALSTKSCVRPVKAAIARTKKYFEK